MNGGFTPPMAAAAAKIADTMGLKFWALTGPNSCHVSISFLNKSILKFMDNLHSKINYKNELSIVYDTILDP